MSQAEKPLGGLFSSKVKLWKDTPVFLLETFLGETRSSPDQQRQAPVSEPTFDEIMQSYNPAIPAYTFSTLLNGL